MSHVWIFASASPPRWCVLRSANPAGRISTLCLDGVDYGPVSISTTEPWNSCPACKRELAAGTPGAAQRQTRDLKRPGAPAADAVEDW